MIEVVLPNDIDDPAHPSGGNAYDRQVCRRLPVREHAVRGSWPRPTEAERAELARTLSGIPDKAVVLVDGLIASAVPEVLRPQVPRLRLVILVHMPLGDAAEGVALATASAIITTSAWTRRRLLDLYALPPDRVHVATPGVDPAPPTTGSNAGTELVCVAAVTRDKGHDLLVDALAKLADLPWTCTCIGQLDRDPDFVDGLRRQIYTDRVRLVGPRTPDRLYDGKDLLVLPSRAETYGMVVTEALARGIPVLATAVGGVAEAMAGGGLLVEPDDSAALAAALRRWLTEPDLRSRLRRAARERRETLTGWDTTAEIISRVLDGVRT